ncbi:MAG TPA: two-component regulator propeller domain-containing protein [Mucilaginibacter sp.]|nr:two-component regulator propeller domain-containing protein [Mucilaginibacter sp.]
MKRILLLVLLSIGLQPVFGQSSHLKFDHFTVQDGLPERQAQFVKQDDMGYIWVGTQNGLLRYDGYKPRVYRFGVDKDAPYQTCTVSSFIIDKNKTIWVSTIGNGLFRYDRLADKFIQYKYPKNGEKISTTQGLAAVDNNNNLWAFNSTSLNNNGVGLAKFKPATGSFESFNKKQKEAHYLDANDLFYICKAAGGIIWIGTNNGLFKYDYKKDQFDPYKFRAGNAHQDSVYTIYEAPSEKGVLWLNTVEYATKKANTVRLDTRTNTVKYFNHETDTHLSSANDTVFSFFENRKKQLWAGTANGLLLFDRQTQSFSKFTPIDTNKDVYKNIIYQISEAKNGSLWLPSGKGLLNFDPKTQRFQRYTDVPNDLTSIGSNTVRNILNDRSGSVFGTVRGQGLFKNNPLTSAFITHRLEKNKADGYPGGTSYQVEVIDGGYALLTNINGVYKWKPGTSQFQQILKANKENGHPYSIAVGKQGIIYFGSKEKGFQVYDSRSGKLQTYASNPKDTTTLINNAITKIVPDHTGLIWIGTDGYGINSFDPVTKKFKRYPYMANDGAMQSHGELDDQRVISAMEDSKGNIWVGTNLGGLNLFDRKTGKFTSYLFDGKIRAFSIVCMFEDRDGMFWVGTYLNGLFKFDPKTRHYTRNIAENDGLLFNSIDAINQDGKGYIWVRSQRGLTRVDPKNFSLKNYRDTEIFPEERTAMGTLDDILVRQGDFMLMNGVNGISYFNPDDLAANPYPPAVHIEKIAYSDPDASTDSATTLQTYGSHGIELPYNQNKLTFSYIALHFANPAQNKYAYMLEGYDKEWVQAGTQRSVTYTNLSPATYTFKVKACNSDGVWNNEGDSFLVIVNSPLWFRWWAWVIYVIVFIAIISGYIAYRSRQLKMENLELEGKVNERTKQLSEANKELSEQQEEIITQRDRLSETVTELKTTQQQLIQSEKLASLGELTAGIAHEIQNPLNFVNNFSEVSVELVDELAEGLHAEKRDTGLEDELLADLKQNLEKITLHGKRADGIVKNMLQHSRANSGERQLTDINTLADEYMRLAYHGLRAKDKNFNSATVTNLDSKLPKIEAIPQDIGRVLLNLFNNAFYAVQQKNQTAGPDYKPEVTVSTSADKDHITIKVKDNGNGIPDAIKDKIMQPFFTTKPTGEGTGLGLSLSYDIVVKGHGGSISVDTKESEFTEFNVTLPI